MENITLFSKSVELAECSENGNLKAKFCLCDFGVNKKGVQLNRNTIENWFGTIINQPLVGKISGNDFTGHNCKIVSRIDPNGNIVKNVEFDTNAFGTFVDASIETIDGVECITATAEVWRRFPLACQVIEKRISEGTLNSSWEIMVDESHKENDVEVIDAGHFAAHCMLGRQVAPAYDSSRLLEVAEEEIDNEFIDALVQDIQSEEIMKKNKTANATDEVISEVVDEQVVENTPVESTSKEEESKCKKEQAEEPDKEKDVPTDEPEDTDEPDKKTDDAKASIEVSALTVCDVMGKLNLKVREQLEGAYVEMILPEDHVALCKYYNGKDRQPELRFTKISYVVNGDEVEIVGEPEEIILVVSPINVNQVMSEKDAAIADASKVVAELKEKIAQLEPFRAAAEAAEAEKKAAEKVVLQEKMKASALKSNLISEEEISGDKTIAQMIEDADEAALNALISQRFIASLYSQADVCEASATVSSASAPVVSSIIAEPVEKDLGSKFIRAFISK